MENQIPEVVSPLQKPKHNFALWVVAGIAILAAGAGIGLAAGKYLFSNKTSGTISSYEDCVKAPGSRTVKSYPGVCTTVDGKNFIQPVKSSDSSSQTKAETLDSTTVDWETYTNSKYNYRIGHPKDWTAKSVEPGPPDLPLNNTSRGIVLYPSKFGSSAQAQSSVLLMIEGPENVVYPTYEKWINDVTKNVYFKILNIEEKQFAGRSAKVVYGEYDGYGFPANIQSIYFSSEDKESYFNISAIDDKSNAELLIINQILSTFKFIEPVVSPTPQISYLKPEISDTSSWKLYTLKNIQFKAPEEARVSITDGDAVITLPEAMIPSANVMLRTYDGGSRREWWIKEINATPDEVSKYMKFQDVMLGGVTALDVFGDGGWWQGGYASPILIAKGKTIIAIHGGRGLNPETGKTSRYIFSDSVASTIQFIN